MGKPIRRWLAGLFLLPALGVAQTACPPPLPQPDAAQMQAAARHDRGFLWSLEREGRHSWLYGTLHVGKPQWTTPGPRVAAALAHSEVLALELDPADPTLATALADAGPAPELPAALRRRLARQMEAACLRPDALAAMNPALQVMVLGVLEARWVGLDAAYAQENALAATARAQGHEVVSLETAALQKKALVPDDPKELVASVESSLDELEDGSGRGQIARLARAWSNGDLATLEHYEQWCGCVRSEAKRAELRALNDDRNPGLAAGIDALERQGRPLFVAVGSLHMTGPDALPELLRGRGFKVERINLAAQD